MILAIDTSGAISVAAVSESGEVLAERTEFAPRGHAELLAGMVQEVLAGAGGETPARIVVGTGPATFTGLRVGLVTARTLGFAWGVPVQGVCSLDALGAEFGTCTVVTDARRREVYWARYEDRVRVAGPDVAVPGDVPVADRVVGRGAALYPDVFTDGTAADPNPRFLVLAADAAAASGMDLPTEPLYLRRPDVHGVPGA
ncbi:tRNA (adenosine(37)-N6)-threonylcarbamoyltransferase complex dimerization subunit type 1 TsaB [Demequina sp.]|uniref:tRNA (adenosine(37)-N6)-threonylcarbamoyltransferase complex dimerization subunit type 1 TsaB n=1 Tax=Demequina sp. TaxID=2050685 RepID=UPI003D0A12B7